MHHRDRRANAPSADDLEAQQVVTETAARIGARAMGFLEHELEDCLAPQGSGEEPDYVHLRRILKAAREVQRLAMAVDGRRPVPPTPEADASPTFVEQLVAADQLGNGRE